MSSFREKKSMTGSFFKNKYIEVHSGVLVVNSVAIGGKTDKVLRELYYS